MGVVKVIFTVLVFIDCYYSTIAMGCKNNIPKNNKINPNHSTNNFTPTDQETTGEVATDQATTNDSMITDQLTTGDVTIDLVSSKEAITYSPSCPPNMVYQNCTTCQGTCSNPKHCTINCTEPGTCLCPDGFLLNVGDCIPEQECECFIEGEGVIQDGNSFVNPSCSGRCNCSAGHLVCEDDYQCNLKAVCEERDNLRKCYCKSGYIGDGVTCTASGPPTDCLDVLNRGNTSNGVYNIKPTTWSGLPFEVYCNMTDEEGWTVFQRRVDGSVDFDLDWDDYKNGFGSPDHEFWMGNEKLFILTNQRSYQLRIDFINQYGAPYYAEYDSFRINNEANNYRLTIGNYSGDAGDCLSHHNNEDFSTRDEDNDDYNYFNFASYYGGWWYGFHCYCALNSDYRTSDFYWHNLPGSYYHVKFTEMKVRPV